MQQETTGQTEPQAGTVPGHLQELERLLQDMNYLEPIPVPPMLESAIGYTGIARLVAFYWEPAGDEASYDDGATAVIGANSQNYLSYHNHWLTKKFLERFNFGDSDRPAEHWLLIDRNAAPRDTDIMRKHADLTKRAYVGSVAEVQLALTLQYAPFEHKTAGAVLRTTAGEPYGIATFTEFLEGLKATKTAIPQQDVIDAMQRQEAAEYSLGQDMLQWLGWYSIQLLTVLKAIRMGTE